MLWKHPWILIVLAAAVTTCTQSAARCDEFVVIARDLESEAFPANTVIELRVYKQLKANSDTPGAIRAGSNFARGVLLGGPVTVTTEKSQFTARFTFKINVDDERLTEKAEKPDRTILLELRRNGGNTAIVPFIAVGEVNNKTGIANNFGTAQILNVAVPEPRPDTDTKRPHDTITCCPPECETPCCSHRGRFRFFRR
jgi:hypothetical protein